MNARFRLANGILVAAAMLAVMLVFAAPVAAGEVVEGQNIVIRDTDDDVYAVGETVTIEGTVDGDVIAFAALVTVNGTITGDLIAGGQAVEINGTVEDDVRLAGAILAVGPGASIGDDLMVGGFALEMGPGSSVGGDLYIGAGQAVVEDVAGSIFGGMSGLRINGVVAGNAMLEVAGDGPPITQFFDPATMGNPEATYEIPSVSMVQPGLSFGNTGEILGSLDLTVTENATPDIDETRVEGGSDINPEAGASLGGGRRRIGGFIGFYALSLLLGGLLLLAAPKVLEKNEKTLRDEPLRVFLLGLLGYAAFFAFVLVIGLLLLAGIAMIGIGAGGAYFNVVIIFVTSVFNAFTLASRWFGPILIAALVGGMIWTMINRDEKRPFMALVIGLLVVGVFLAIPFIGRPLIGSVLRVIGVGALLATYWPRKNEPLTGPEADTGETLAIPQGDTAPTKPSGPEADQAPVE